MLITRTGLLFQQNGKDGFARAYDVETGKVLWKGKTAGQSIGIPAMYESQGRQYIVFMSPPAGRGGGGERPSTTTGRAAVAAMAAAVRRKRRRRPQGRTATSRSRCRRSNR